VTIFWRFKQKLFLGKLFFRTQGMCDKIFYFTNIFHKMMKIHPKKVIEQESFKKSSILSNVLSFIAISFGEEDIS